jgi:hypothetical protein
MPDQTCDAVTISFPSMTHSPCEHLAMFEAVFTCPFGHTGASRMCYCHRNGADNGSDPMICSMCHDSGRLGVHLTPVFRALDNADA